MWFLIAAVFVVSNALELLFGLVFVAPQLVGGIMRKER